MTTKQYPQMDASMDALQRQLDGLPERVVEDFYEKFLISWLYHDNALEGIVLSYHEIKAAVDDRIISDSTLLPMYDEIAAHKQAVDFIREHAKKKRSNVTMEFIKKLHKTLTVEEDPEYQHYRKENPLHRLYFHEILPPEKIPYRLRKLVEWAKSDEFRKAHPIVKAAQLHLQFITIYPWVKNSGKVARLLMNYILLKHDYVPAVIHAVDRQRYYEALRAHSHVELASLIEEALHNALESTTRYLTELAPKVDRVA